MAHKPQNSSQKQTSEGGHQHTVTSLKDAEVGQTVNTASVM